MAKDPICGMEVDETTAAAKIGYKGDTYYFCAPGCLQEFVKEPEKYLPLQGASKKSLTDSAVQTGDNQGGHQ